MEVSSKRLMLDLANLKATSEDLRAFRSKYELEETDKQLLYFVDLAQSLWGGGTDVDVRRLRDLLLPEDGLAMVGINIRTHKLTYTPRNVWQAAFYYLTENSHLAKRCGNVKCGKQFFFGKRPNERYCTPRCFDEAQKAAKTDWWKVHGEEINERRKK
jgi:hypothetical protein